MIDLSRNHITLREVERAARKIGGSCHAIRGPRGGKGYGYTLYMPDGTHKSFMRLWEALTFIYQYKV